MLKNLLKKNNYDKCHYHSESIRLRLRNLVEGLWFQRFDSAQPDFFELHNRFNFYIQCLDVSKSYFNHYI